MALLAARGQLSLARQGQALLEQKRDALLREFYREVRVVFAAREELDAAAGLARLALDEARVRLGAEPVAAAAAGALRDVAVELEAMTVMGVAVPAIAPRSLVRHAEVRGRDPAVTGPALELAAERFEEELTVAIRLATVEARVRRLAAEIRRTSSRVSALRTRVVPALDAEVRAITLALEQRERDDRFRLKRVKAARERRLAQRAVRARSGPSAGGTLTSDREGSGQRRSPTTTAPDGPMRDLSG
jgi:V/A-type H+-transporting ATPase subunit D